jgi:CcmD family protein
MNYMVAAYMVIWLATFAFVFSISHRQTNLRKELAALQEVVNEQQGPQ